MAQEFKAGDNWLKGWITDPVSGRTFDPSVAYYSADPSGWGWDSRGSDATWNENPEARGRYNQLIDLVRNYTGGASTPWGTLPGSQAEAFAAHPQNYSAGFDTSQFGGGGQPAAAPIAPTAPPNTSAPTAASAPGMTNATPQQAVAYNPGMGSAPFAALPTGQPEHVQEEARKKNPTLTSSNYVPGIGGLGA